MAGDGSSKSSSTSRLRKRVEAESSSAASSLKRAKDGSAFAKCEECHKDVPVALISFHNCSLDAKIRMNLETIAVEVPAETATKKKKAASSPTEPKPKREKKAKSKDGPKRPPTAFFLFMQEFRKSYMEENPGCKKVSEVAKEGGVKWKALTDEERKVYVDKAAELKAEFGKMLDESKEAENEQDAEVIEVDDKEDEAEMEVKEEEEIQEEKQVDDEKIEIKEEKQVDEKKRIKVDKKVDDEKETKDEEQVDPEIEDW